MKEHERRTSWKVVITYLFVIALCGAMFYYIYNLQGFVQNQKLNIKTQNTALDLTNRFTQLVHEAQNEANLFAFSDNPKHLKRFGALNNEISHAADSLLLLMPSEQNEQRLREVERLIMRKGQISYVLSRQFYYYDPMAEIDAKLKSYTVTDTTRLDTLGKVTDSINILNDLKLISDKARLEFKKRVKEYEKKTVELITDDNHLSEEIADLLLALNKEILDTSVVEIEKSENIIRENVRLSTLIAGAVILLIIIFIIMILIDVNKGFRARKAAEKARADAEEAKKKTEEIMESRHKMLLSVSHDIKTPLTSIMGNLEIMDNTGNEKEAHSIQQSADHILTLLSDLLEFSSLEQGTLQIEKKWFIARNLCDETASMFEPLAHNKNLIFKYKNELKRSLSVHSDRLKIKQIISNLISNAVKYTLEGEIRFRVTFENSSLVFRVQDSGIGIPDDKIDDIFKPFVRIENSLTQSEGSGYGLSVVKGLVDLLEGDIGVSSELGKGSLFTVRIPVEYELVEGGDQKPLEDGEEEEVHTEPAPQHHILIIDDDDTLLTVVSNMLAKLGHEVLICRSKNDLDGALGQLDTFDCVLTDREMGALSGNDILKQFKETALGKPVYLMTARVDYDFEKATQEGFDGFLQKPFNLKDLEHLFGCHTLKEEKTSVSSFTDFPALSEMMGDDEEAIRGILKVFAHSTADHLVAMNDYIEQDNFAGAHVLCHKMLPMFIQLQQEEAVPFLSRMNDSRGSEAAKREYPEWKEDAYKFMECADSLLDMLSERYGIF